MNTITQNTLLLFRSSLHDNEKSEATVEKYVFYVERMLKELSGGEMTKEFLLKYRNGLMQKYRPQTVNGNLSAINAFLTFYGLPDMKLKLLKVQRQIFLAEERELSKDEYMRLLRAARYQNDERLYMLLLTLGSTGIRISELSYITVEAAASGQAQVRLKGKNRTIIIRKELRKQLLEYAKKRGIESGHIFRTRSGRALDRSNICHDMKKLCPQAQVEPCKVFPHSIRHLFARAYYGIEKDLAHLADVLGHSQIETTRIYVAASVRTHEKILDRMGLIL